MKTHTFFRTYIDWDLVIHDHIPSAPNLARTTSSDSALQPERPKRPRPPTFRPTIHGRGPQFDRRRPGRHRTNRSKRVRRLRVHQSSYDAQGRGCIKISTCPWPCLFLFSYLTMSSKLFATSFTYIYCDSSLFGCSIRSVHPKDVNFRFYSF